MSQRQKNVPGWDQQALGRAIACVIGCGGVGGEVVHTLVRKGIGCIHAVDGDFVTTTDLNRQAFYDIDVLKPKATQLIRRMQRQGYLGTTLVAHPVFSNELDIGEIGPDVIVVGVDLKVKDTRLDLCRYGLTHNVPIIFAACDPHAQRGYVMVQEPGEEHPCFCCVLRPDRVKEELPDKMCPGDVGACCDILKVLAGYACYALDSIIMRRERDWNYCAVFLGHRDFGRKTLRTKRPDCPECGGGQA